MFSSLKPTGKSALQFNDHLPSHGGGGGVPHVKRTTLLIGNFENNL